MEKKVFDQGTLNNEHYNERIKNYINYAEDRFENYCKQRGYKFKKLCLNQDDDPYKNPIPHWQDLGIMRAQPDYICTSENRTWYAEIKASNKLKLIDLKKYCGWEALMVRKPKIQYYICFCFKDKMIIKTIDQILELLPKAKVDQYHEGHKYYILPV